MQQIMITINKKSHIILILIFLILLGFSGTVVAKTKIISPLDKAVISENGILVIGLTDKDNNAEKVDLIIANTKGKTTLSLQITEHTFSKHIELAPGLNKISLKQNNDSLEVFYTDSGAGAPKGFKPFYSHKNLTIKNECDKCHVLDKDKNKELDYTYIEQSFTCMSASCHQKMGKKKFQHGPFKQKQCVNCHNPHGNFNKNYTLKLRAELCFTCHTEAESMATDGKYVHFPVSKGECTSCHDPHESNMEYHLKRGTILELCAGCHGKKILQNEFMHEPVAEGDCNACHTPHTSNIKGLLYKKGSDLCLTCHEVRKEEFKSRYVHKPVSQDCTICHDPHGSATEFHLRSRKNKAGHYIKSKQPIKDLCLSCHTKLNPKIAKAIKSAKFQHKPVQDGKCLYCHTPHSTNFPKQLKALPKDLCFSCHKKIAKKINGSLFKHGPVRKGDCTQCHLVHGSNNKNLLRNNFSSELSGNFSLDNFRLCLNCHNKKVYTEKRSKDTGFRNGSTNLHFLHVNRKDKSRYCKSCHNIHASNQERHIRESMVYKKRFKISLKFTKTATGGGCVVGCHKPQKYDRKNPDSYK
jgi:predicted CXXCH cytochrome family protein